MTWTKTRILQELKSLHKKGRDISYNGLARTAQPLVSAAAYHFKSYRRAVELAGIDYAIVLRRPRWTRTRIIALIKDGRKRNLKLHWSAVTHRRDELGKAAFASLQKRLFGRWDRALEAAGLNPDDVSQYRRWDHGSIVAELRRRHRKAEPLSSGSVQQKNPALHAAAVRHFGDYDAALIAAKLDPQELRKRQRWSKEEVIKALKTAARSGKRMSSTQARHEIPAAHGAAVRLFGSFTRARDAAGIKYSRPKRRKKK
jgi:hypothetical protein